MSHFIKICEECKDILNQCRCPAKDKNVIYGICSRCRKKKEEQEIIDDLDAIPGMKEQAWESYNQLVKAGIVKDSGKRHKRKNQKSQSKMGEGKK